MARPLRIESAGGWHHVMSRGHRGGNLFLNDTDRRRFLGLVAEIPERFRVETHTFVLMDNHYHLLVRTPEANLSHAMRWLNVSYGVKFNWAHSVHGAVFQGRFKSVLIQDEAGVTEVARYLHLNPVRLTGLGLGKEDQRRAKVVGCDDPGKALVEHRLQLLRDYAWSSWRVYSGAESTPSWLDTSVISKGCGGRTRADQRAALKEYTESPLRQGHLPSPWERLVGGSILGDADFAKDILSGRRVNLEEQTAARRLRHRSTWEEVVRATERVVGTPWSEWAGRHGDWTRDGALYVAVRYGGVRLTDVVKRVEGLRYQAAAQAVKRFVATLEKDEARRRFVTDLKRQLSTI